MYYIAHMLCVHAKGKRGRVKYSAELIMRKRLLLVCTPASQKTRQQIRWMHFMAHLCSGQQFGLLLGAGNRVEEG